MSKSIPPTYKTTNWAEYNAALKRRGLLTIWFDPQITRDAELPSKRGRQQTYSDAAIQTCLTLKVVFRMTLCQTTGFATSLLKLADLDWPVSDFSTLSRRQKNLAVGISCRKSSEPLHLPIGSTGIKVEGDGEWHARKHKSSKRRQWRKLHIALNEGALEIRAVEITGVGVGDTPMLPELRSQIPLCEDIATVTADGAYDTCKCHDAIAKRGVAGIIPSRKNAKPRKLDTEEAIVRNEALRACNQFGQALWKRWTEMCSQAFGPVGRVDCLARRMIPRWASERDVRLSSKLGWRWTVCEAS